MSSEIERVLRHIHAEGLMKRTPDFAAAASEIAALSPPSSATPGDGGRHDWSGDGEHCAKCGDPDWCSDAVCRGKPQPQERAGSDAGAYSTGSDREMLNYLMQQFDAEFHACGRCGHEEPTKDYDSAIHLREYLATRPQPASDASGEVERLANNLEFLASKHDGPGGICRVPQDTINEAAALLRTLSRALAESRELAVKVANEANSWRLRAVAAQQQEEGAQ